MNQDLARARQMLADGGYTCVLCLGDKTHVSRARGVAPLLAFLDGGIDLRGFAAADRVVGKGAAHLYVLLGVSCVHADVMSRGAERILTASGIAASCGVLADGIRNRRNDGPCPMESAVGDLTDSKEALLRMREALARMAQQK